MTWSILLVSLLTFPAEARTTEGPAFSPQFFAMDKCLQAAVQANQQRIAKLPSTLASLEKRYQYAGLGHLSMVNGTKLTIMSPEGQYELGAPGELNCRTAKGNSSKDGLNAILTKYGQMDAEQKALLNKACQGVVDFAGTPKVILNPGAAAPAPDAKPGSEEEDRGGVF